jgi:sigma-B regulation protein RsbU (phosphoserine phosphatase)
VVADVAGKGIPAALLVFTLNATLHALVGELAGGKPLTEFVSDMNRAVFRSSTSSRFITCFFAILDPARGTIVSVNAGHNAPILMPASRKEHRELRSGGLCLGMFEAPRYQQELSEILPGDTLTLYSDGVTEAMNLEADEFGTDRLLDTLRVRAGQEPGAVVQAVTAAVERHVGAAPQSDDITVVVLRRLPGRA